MSFMFNPCRPCCETPKCGICGNLSLPRSWNLTFNGVGSDTAYTDTIDGGEEPCSQIFRPLVASFSPGYDSPCAWKGSATKIIKTCSVSNSCGKCMCDCNTCFSVLMNPIRRPGSGLCRDIVFGGGWMSATIGDVVNCKWYGSGGPGCVIQLKKDVPVTLTVETNANFGATVWRAVYEVSDKTCQDYYEFSLASQVDPNGYPQNIWPPTVKVYKTGCGPLPDCLCSFCDYSWAINVDKLEVLPGFIADKTSTWFENYGGTHDISQVAWPGGDLSLFRYPDNDQLIYPRAYCLWQGDNNGDLTQAYYDANGEQPIPPGTLVRGAYIKHPEFNVSTWLVPSINGDNQNTFVRAIALTVVPHFYYANLASNPFADNPIGYRCTMVYVDNPATATSDCEDYVARDFHLFPLVSRRTSSNLCGEVSETTFDYLQTNWGYTTGDPQDVVIHWPEKITLKRIPISNSDSRCPNPYKFVTDQPSTVGPVNTGSYGQFTDDVKTDVEITVSDAFVNAKVTATYTRRCHDIAGPLTLKDVKNYRMALSSFSCLGVNGLSLVDDPAGTLCKDWPSSITLTP